jgi:hypothetical protein
MEATYLVVLLCINYDHTHLKVDMHPAKTIHPEIIILVRIFECRIQILTAFVGTTISGNAGKDHHHLTSDLIETTFQDHSPQDQVVETPTSKSQMIDNALVSNLIWPLGKDALSSSSNSQYLRNHQSVLYQQIYTQARARAFHF